MPWLKRLAVLVLALGAIFLIDRRSRPRPKLEAEWLQAGDVTVRAVRAGAGDTTIVFIHGYGESLLSWRGPIDAFRSRFRVVAFDVPGFGVSDKPAGPYDLDTQTRRLADLLDRWTTGPVIVAGHSMGGELAMSLALRRPERVVALVLVSPAGAGLADRLVAMDAGTIDLIGVAGAAATAGILPVHDEHWLAEPAAKADYLPATDPAYRAALGSVLATFDFAALADSLDRIRQPVLLIWGRMDPTIPFTIGERMAATLPCRRFEPLDATLHRPQQTDPDTVVALMRSFFQDPRCATPSDSSSR
jgi:pimeloyl-ACP methyl ester carboxylesterase